MLPHTGFIYYSDIVQDTPPDLRRKAARLVVAKSTLAARVDACHESSDGHVGQMLREEIEKKLDKLTEPPPVKFVKPLPKPIAAGRKKRGGKRVRKMKERYAMTEFRKQANRLNFADIEDDAYQEDLGYTRGTIGKTGTGRIRLPQIDEKTKVCFASPTFSFLINDRLCGLVLRVLASDPEVRVRFPVLPDFLRSSEILPLNPVVDFNQSNLEYRKWRQGPSEMLAHGKTS
jgi:hypothetical protein